MLGTGTAVLAIVLVVLWLTLQWGILPNLHLWRGAVEQHASRALGLPVTIGALRARSTGFIPDIELSDVVVHDPSHREALRLTRVAGRASLRSLFTLRPHFTQLLIESPTLDIRRDAQGRLHVAGLALDSGNDHKKAGGGEGADWLFEQAEVMVRGAAVRWTDEQRAAPPLLLEQVDFVSRNRLAGHELSFDATPPRAWGDRFSLRASFTQPFVSNAGFVAASDWRSWTGHIDIDLPRADAAELRRYVDLPFKLDTGRGSAQARLALERGELRSARADIALADVALRWADGLAPWDIAQLNGRIVMRHTAELTRVALEGFAFTTPDGRAWPKGDLTLTLRGPAQAPTGGELEAQRIDLALLGAMTARLPLAASQRARLESMNPRGHAERFVAQWDGPIDAPASWRLRASILGLSLRENDVPLVADVRRQLLGRPGVEGARIDVDANPRGGEATLLIERGSATFPGVLEQPRVPFDQLSAKLRWTLTDVAAAPTSAETSAPTPAVPTSAAPKPAASAASTAVASVFPRVTLVVSDASFSNADAQGRLSATWRSGDTPESRTPGTLELDAKLDRGKATSVARYLPLGLPEAARRYAAQALLDGRLSDATFQVKGDLRAFPFAKLRADGAAEGVFRFAARVNDGRMNIAPALHTSDGSTPAWPVLEAIAGDIAFDRSSMQLRGLSGRVDGVDLAKVQGDVDFARAPSLLTIEGQALGAAADMLRFVRRSPVDGWTRQALTQATATGPAELRLALALPLADLQTSTVRGTVTLAGNDVRLRPDVPLLAQARGTVAFTERGLRLDDAQARVYGGDATFQGGTRDDGVLAFQVQGVMSADGLAQAQPELGEITRLHKVMQGQSPYKLDLTFRGGQAEWVLDTTLVGMAVNLPSPLGKTADQSQPLRVSTRVVPGARGDGGVAEQRPSRDVLRVDAGALFKAHYLRDLGGNAAKVVAGGIGIGADAPQPERGVQLAIKARALDVDSWRRAAVTLGIDLGGGTSATPGATAAASTTRGNPTASAVTDAATDNGYTPRTISLDVDELRIDARKLNRLTAGLTQDDAGVWRATLEATQMAGFASWRPASRGAPPRLQARLSRLSIPASESVDAMFSDDAPDNPPALDIVIDDFELRDRKLGRVEIEATHERVGNDALAWTLKRLAVVTPEARLTGTGRWMASTDGSKSRRTVVDFKLDLADSGAFLTRFGLPGVIRGGQGAIGGQVSWAGSPITWHAPSLAGAINLRLDAGQFLKAGPGAASLLGVLNLQALPRRLLFDFRDVFSEGFAFDSITGDLRIAQGQATTNNVRMRGVQAVVLMEGSADVLQETQDLRVWVVPEIDAGTAALAYAAINPAIGLGTFLAQLFLRRPLMEASTREFRVQGSWADPKVERLERKSGDRIPEYDVPAAPALPAAPAEPPPAAPSEPTPATPAASAESTPALAPAPTPAPPSAADEAPQPR